MNADADADDGAVWFAPPPFKPAETLVQLQRTLRALGGLSERGPQFEWKGHPLATLALDGAQITARLARRPASTPDWELRAIKNGADARKFGDDVKQRLARWKHADD